MHGDIVWRRTVLGLSWATTLLLVSVLSSRAAPPTTSSRSQLSFQFRLTSPNGQPMSGLIDATVSLYDVPSGGTALWSERQDLRAQSGIVSATLGLIQPLDASVFAPGTPAERYVGVEVGGTEVARVKLTATAYAIVASVADTLANPAGAPVDLADLDDRYIQTNGAGGGVVRTVNGVAPNGSGDFSVAGAASGRIVVTPTTNGVEIDTAGNLGGIDEATADARYVNTSGDTITGGLTVNGGINTQGHCHIAGDSDVTNARVWQTLTTNRIVGGNGLSISGPNGDIGLVIFGATTFRPTENNFNLPPYAVFHSNSCVFDTFVMANGGLAVPANKTKAFYHDLGDGTAIYYCSLEGPGCDNFVRGQSRLSNGGVVIDLPDHFTTVTEDTGQFSALVTPRGPSAGLYVVSVNDRQLEVRENPGGTGDVTFDYFVMGVRLGHLGEQIVRPSPTAQAPTSDHGH
jgi:hypothetical protein